MPAKTAKSKAPRRNDDVIAEYTGANWQLGRCLIGRCDHRIVAGNYQGARDMMAAHREEVH